MVCVSSLCLSQGQSEQSRIAKRCRIDEHRRHNLRRKDLVSAQVFHRTGYMQRTRKNILLSVLFPFSSSSSVNAPLLQRSGITRRSCSPLWRNKRVRPLLSLISSTPSCFPTRGKCTCYRGPRGLSGRACDRKG